MSANWVLALLVQVRLIGVWDKGVPPLAPRPILVTASHPSLRFGQAFLDEPNTSRSWSFDFLRLRRTRYAENVKREPMMLTVPVKARLEADGILKLLVPTGLPEADVDVIVIVQLRRMGRFVRT